jgi:general secretion pathway protein K
MKPRHRQEGLALITAMLVFAIVATISAFLALGQQVWLRQVQNLFDRSQADSMRHAALEFAGLWLARDVKNNPTTDLTQPWAKSGITLPVLESSAIKFTIVDAQGLFNLNTLVRGGAPVPANAALFRKLLQLQSLDPALADAVIDWIDTDSNRSPAGAEDMEYLAGNPPYRAANTKFSSVDELRLVRGFTAEIVDKLRPYITVLPEDNTTININTAPDVVLAALCPDMQLTQAQPIVAAQTQSPFKNKGDLNQYLAGGRAPVAEQYDVKTSYFLIDLSVYHGRAQRQTRALIQRTADGKGARVLWHHPYPLSLPKLPGDGQESKDKG